MNSFANIPRTMNLFFVKPFRTNRSGSYSPVIAITIAIIYFNQVKKQQVKFDFIIALITIIIFVNNKCEVVILSTDFLL